MWEATWEILGFTLFYSVQFICIVSFAKKQEDICTRVCYKEN